MQYRFVCPGKPATKGFRHHIYCDYPPVDYDDELFIWCVKNFGPRGENWKVFWFYDPDTRGLGGWWCGDRYYHLLFAFKNEKDAMLFKVVWG